MLLKLNDGESVTVCMNHEEYSDHYTVVRRGNCLSMRYFGKINPPKTNKTGD